MQPVPPILDYAQPHRREQPLDSRIMLESLPGGGVRLTAPPRGWWAALWTIPVVALVSGVFLLWPKQTIVDMLEEPTPISVLKMIASILGTGVMIAVLWFYAYCYAKRPTIIEASGGALTLTQPVPFGATRHCRRGQIVDIRASMPMPNLRLKIVRTVIVITHWRLSVPLLSNRESAEALWVVNVLRLAMEMGTTES